MSSAYSELRPAYTGENTYTSLITIEGSGSIAGQTFSGAMGYLDGPVIPGAASVSISDAANRIIAAVFKGQATQGQFTYSVRRTDDGSNLVVSYGVIELSAAL